MLESIFEWQQGLGRMNGSALPLPYSLGHRTLSRGHGPGKGVKIPDIGILPLTIFVHAKKPGILKLTLHPLKVIVLGQDSWAVSPDLL